jgi:hypothetical protein
MSSFASPFIEVLKKLDISGHFLKDNRQENLPAAGPA